ncbi:MAG: glycosyltransferase family 4 protein [Bacteroidota bacterium]
MASPGKRVLIIVENLPVPFDKRVWNEATTLTRAGYTVSVICPTGKGYESRHEILEGVAIYRHPLPPEGNGAMGYLREYSAALWWEFVLSVRVLRERGFDAIHACNPPDLIFLIGAFYKLFGKRFLFDHHDINPELYEAKFGRKDLLYRLIVLCERLTFRTADISIATNQSYKEIAVARGGMDPGKVYIVRSGPNVSKFRPVAPCAELKRGFSYLVGYVGVMGKQEGLDYLLRTVHTIVQERGRKDVLFVLIGSGTEFSSLQTYAKDLGVADYVQFTGRISDAELLSYLSTAEVCVNPDVATEMNDKSTMNKIMEYMALGKPIVQFDLTEGRRSADEASLYADRNDPVDFAEKILELLADPTRRARMGQIGKERVENELAWEYSAEVLLQSYENLFANF